LARNGAGTYNLPAGQPVVTGTVISSTTFNTLTSDIATALTASIANDGQTVPVANLPMGGFKLTGLGAATVNGDAVRYQEAVLAGADAKITSMTALTAPTVAANPMRATDEQIQLVTAFTTGGSSTAYTLTPAPATTANVTNQRFRVKFNAASGATPTLAVSGQTAKSLKYYDSSGTKQAITSTQVPINWISDVEYDGTDWVVLQTVPPVSITAGKAQDFRLTLTSATPVTTADVTGATTIYCTPYKGNQIALYDGSSTWNTRTSAEFSLALGTLTSGKPYDVFCYDNAGTPTLEFLAWTNDTTRATALVYQDGVLVKSGATTRRYLGTFYTTATTTTEDSASKRYLWNYYNRIRRSLVKTDATASWTYATGSYRQGNNSAANQVEAIQGVAEDIVDIMVSTTSSISAASGSPPAGVGVDSVTVNSAQQISTSIAVSGAAFCTSVARYKSVPAVGRHYYAWLETGAANLTLYGGSGGNGIIGEVMA